MPPLTCLPATFLIGFDLRQSAVPHVGNVEVGTVSVGMFSSFTEQVVVCTM